MGTSQPDSERLLNPMKPEALHFEHVTADRRREAVGRLLSRPALVSEEAVDRFLVFAGENKINVDGMWIGCDAGGSIVVTVFAVPNPGRTAILFTNVLEDEKNRPEQSRLIAHVSVELRDQDIDMVQTLIDPRDKDMQAVYCGGGFTTLARLSYLERSIPPAGRAPAPKWPDDITIETYRDTLRADVIEALDASYIDTRDCPGLRGLRRTEDIFAGHLGTGEFDPALWTLLRAGGAPAGVLMLNPSPGSNAIELVYIGLGPAARGRSLGKLLLKHGLHLISGREERAVTLAVDDENAPAIALYRSLGFRRVSQRTALIRSLRAPTTLR